MVRSVPTMHRRHVLSVQSFLAVFLTLGFILPSIAVEKPSHRAITDIDTRRADRQPLTPKRKDGLDKLQTRLPQTRVDFHAIHGSPQWVRSSSGALSKRADPAARPAQPILFEPAGPIKAFVSEYSDLFGHEAAGLSSTVLKRQSTNSHNGVRSFAWEQRLDEIPVHGSIFLGHVTAQGDVVSISSTFMPDAEQAADAGTPNRFALQANPPLSARDAIVAAAVSIDQPVEIGLLDPHDAQPQGQ